jgi:tRNA A37 N6-isopentenylltransferase MiaA
MFIEGLEEEKRKLHEEYPVWSKTAALAIGYREGDTRDKIFVRTCQLAKRQDTWFRHQASAIYVPVGETAEETARNVKEVWQSKGPWKVRFCGAS